MTFCRENVNPSDQYPGGSFRASDLEQLALERAGSRKTLARAAPSQLRLVAYIDVWEGLPG